MEYFQYRCSPWYWGGGDIQPDPEGVFDLLRSTEFVTAWPTDAAIELKNDWNKGLPKWDFLNYATFPLVSEKVRTGILQIVNEADVQFLPVKICKPDGKDQVTYYFLHVLRTEDCLDCERTTVSVNRYEDGSESHILFDPFGATLDHSRISAGAHLFVLPKYQSLFFSGALVDALEEMKVTGMHVFFLRSSTDPPSFGAAIRPGKPAPVARKR